MVNKMSKEKNYLVWMDLEMTGLEPEVERIIEIATLVTDAELNLIAEGPELVIHQPDALLDAMDDWNKEHHGASGLLARVRASTVTEAEAERLTLEFLKAHVPAKSVPLCGNSIAQDRRFLVKYMAELNEHLHYRNVDVSTIKELVKRWYPDSYQAPRKQATHRALDDIRESINELRFYKERVFVKIS
jgi:oligoribonuclease